MNEEDNAPVLKVNDCAINMHNKTLTIVLPIEVDSSGAVRVRPSATGKTETIASSGGPKLTTCELSGRSVIVTAAAWLQKPRLRKGADVDGPKVRKKKLGKRGE